MSETRAGINCPNCASLSRELVAKTHAVELYLFSVLQENGMPGGIVNEFKRRWRTASLLGTPRKKVLGIARNVGVQVTLDMPFEQICERIAEAEYPP